MKNLFLLLFFSFCLGLSLQISSISQAKCFEWDHEEIDQYVGRCTNQNYEKLAKNGGPRKLRCTNWSYPFYWSCYHLWIENGRHKQSIQLDEAANKACGCSTTSLE